jgi:hypothetical protein
MNSDVSTCMQRRKRSTAASRRMPRVADGLLAGAVANCLETHGYLVLRPRARLSSRWGLADMIGIREGHTIFVLAGSPPGRLSRRTQHFVENVRRAGCEFVVVHDLEDVVALARSRADAGDAFAAPAAGVPLRAAPSAASVRAARRLPSRTTHAGPRQRAAEPYAAAR